MKRSDIYLALVILLITYFLGGLTEFVAKIGIPKVHYGTQDTITVIHCDTIKDSTPYLINRVTIKTVHDTFNHPTGYATEEPETLATYTTGKRYNNGDSIAVSVTSSILPVIAPQDWVWGLERYSNDSTRTINRIDTIQHYKSARWGIGPYAGYGYGDKGFTASAGVCISWHVFTF